MNTKMNTKLNTPTPRTDAESFYPHDSKEKAVDSFFAQQLERELATITAQRDQLRAALDWLNRNVSVQLEEYRGGSRTDGGTPWYCWEFSSPLNDKHEAGAAIDAAMKEDAK